MENSLKLTLGAAAITTVSTLFAFFIKDFLLVRYFDAFREKRSLEKISKKYKDPILLSGAELLRRVYQYVDNYDELRQTSGRSVLFSEVQKMQNNNANDPYYMNYRQISTLYRFCSFFGWFEVFRQEITFLDNYSKNKTIRSLELMAKIREAIADGHIHEREDWDSWKDSLIFREELRAIGEGMIEQVNGQKTIIGYGKFKSLILEFGKTGAPWWLAPPINFFTDFQEKKDFRYERLKLLESALSEFISYLDHDYYNKRVKLNKSSLHKNVPA